MCDYELSLIQAIEDTMPGVRIRACFFHYRKALRFNLGKRQMIRFLKKDKKFRHSFNLFAALAFVPVEDVKPLFDLMIAEQDFHQDLLPFANEYFRPIWVEDRNGGEGRYKKDAWNVHERLLFI